MEVPRHALNRISNPFFFALLYPQGRHIKMAFAAINATSGPIAAVEEAFATEPSLKKRVYDAIGA